MSDRASDSGERRANDDRVPNWFAKLVIACMGSIALGIGSWALYSVKQLEKNDAVKEQRLNEHDNQIKEMKATTDKEISEIKSWMQRIGEKLDRVSEAVGARKP